ncbi:INSIG family protein [Hyalangium versicolor]|uniref:INSIG family protein n=1 Tax=Hyalangium versicolor TaxID=2861190 RepID=UPI001CCE82E6|nr:INSIG family protein [Hyalangium versicolor]
MSETRQRLLRTTLILAGLGATLGSALDGIHSHFGALSYTSPFFAQAAWWVPLLFSGAYAGGVARPWLGRDPAPIPAWKAALAMGLFIAAYWLTVAPGSWIVRSAILTGIFGISWWICDRTGIGIALAVMTAIVGPFVEIVLVHAGTFVHHEVLFLGIPGWLPFLYLTAAVGLGSLGRWLAQQGGEPSLSTAREG